MATQTIIDLNDLVPDDKKVTLGNDTYTLPGDMPLDTFLRIQRATQAEKEEDSEKAIQLLEGLRDALVDLFVVKLVADGLNVDALNATREKVRDQLSLFGIGSLFKLMNTVYGDLDEDAEDDDEDESAEGKSGSGTKNSSRKRAAKNAS